MLEPPRRLPKDIENAQTATERDEARLMAKIGIAASACPLMLVPILILFGLRDVGCLGTFFGFSLAMLLTSIVGARGVALRITSAIFIVEVIAMNVLLARMFTPFLVAPATASLSLAQSAFLPSGRSRLVMAAITICMIVGIIAVYAAGAFGLSSPAMIQHGASLSLNLSLDGAEHFAMGPAWCVFIVLLMPIAGSASYVAMRAARRSQQQLQIQQWHLRQLIGR
jgi:hypothetical protein